MNYKTVYRTSDPGAVPRIESLLSEHQIESRVFKGGTNDTAPQQIKIQVAQEHKERASQILLKNNFLRRPPITQESSGKNRFWLFLLFTVIVIILIGLVVNLLMG
ncbi:MAG TPA: hypothetical protein VFM60_02630 [Salinimicrobium sp.]|nr:hypothetical protein [Salinimicrobium sp.]